MKYLVIYLIPVILVLFVGSSILSANSAFGLSCDATNMMWSFEETDVIFLGKALSKEYQPNPTREDRMDAVTLFSIIEPYKGIYQEKIKITSSEWHWGANFTENSNYVVFANNNDGNFEHALCTPTQLASESNISEIRKISQNYILPPLVQFEFGVNLNEIQCKQNLVLIQKYDGSPACVTEPTKQKLIERGWTGENSITNGTNTNTNQNDLLKQNIIRMEDGRISLYPEGTCASISLELLAEKDIQRYKNDQRGLNATNVLPITTDDFDEIPILEELIYAVNLLEFPYNEHSSAYVDGLTFVEYEFFLMDKAIQKYGDSQDSYFIKLDKDYEERFSNPKKQGFSNTFESPLITYNNKTYSISGTVFWTTDEHHPMRMTVTPVDEIKNDVKVIELTDEDMKSIPKIKQAIKEIGTIKESIHGSKGVSEGTQNEYMQWLEEKSKERLGSDRFRLIEYDKQLYAVSFIIC